MNKKELNFKIGVPVILLGCAIVTLSWVVSLMPNSEKSPNFFYYSMIIGVSLAIIGTLIVGIPEILSRRGK
jgi:drug/metabolite transporter (DMT)-like permease